MTNDESRSVPVQHSKLDPQRAPFAWEPLTPRGVAAFATASLGRLALVQLIVALLAATTIAWFLHSAWFPTVQEAIKNLPAQGDIRGGQFDWRGDTPARLAEGLFLSFVVDLNHGGGAGRVAQVQVELGKDDFKVCSLLGCVTLRYPNGWVVALNRTELEPQWGALEPAMLATIYCVPTWIIALYENRDLSLRESWRLASAALLPGALLLTAAIFFYGLNLIDLVRLGLSAGLHLMIGWIYLFISPLCLPRRFTGTTGKGNPFSSSAKEAGPASKQNGNG
jgi:hypothetical protein